MLARDQRVRRGSEFAAAIRAGRRAGRGALVVHLLTAPPSTVLTAAASTAAGMPTVAGSPTVASIEPASAGERSPTRAGFVVPKAVGNAVVRNLVRRRLRHLVRSRLGALPAGATLVVRAQAGAAGLTYTELGQQLDGALVTASRPRSSGRR